MRKLSALSVKLLMRWEDEFYTTPKDLRVLTIGHGQMEVKPAPTREKERRDYLRNLWLDGDEVSRSIVVTSRRAGKTAMVNRVVDACLDPESPNYVGHIRARQLGVKCLCPPAQRNINCPWHGR